jgi:hypothetical protein
VGGASENQSGALALPIAATRLIRFAARASCVGGMCVREREHGIVRFVG